MTASRMGKKYVWTTKDGRKVPVREMTDSHLENTIKYLERVVHNAELNEAMFLEMMFDRAAEDDLIGRCESEDHECDMPPIYYILCEEKERREIPKKRIGKALAPAKDEGKL